jgi:hypothetical protein
MRGNTALKLAMCPLTPYIQSSTIINRLHIYVTNFRFNSYNRLVLTEKGISVKDPLSIQKPCHGTIFNSFTEDYIFTKIRAISFSNASSSL